MTRRNLLVAGASSAVLAGGLAACDLGGGSSGGTTTGAGKPRRGGTLRIGMITGGTAELVIPSATGAFASFLRTATLYDPLFVKGDDLHSAVPALALSAEPNKNATVWTLTLRDGVRWHDGKPFTADDVVYTIKSWQDPKSETFGQFNGIIDYQAVRARGPLTVEVPLVASLGSFPSYLVIAPSLYIVPAGSRISELEHNPIGTGPFKYVSFKPGVESVFVRNPDYWQHGKPLVDRLVINSSFSSDTARLNAFLGKEIDILANVPPVQAKQISASSSGSLLRAQHTASPTVFYMDTKRAPFTDARVRQALRLLVDRQAMVDTALSGFGTVGNDLMGVGSEFFASDLVRDRDVEKAKSLLKAAGQEGLTVTLTTSNAIPGFTEAATVFAQQASDAGVKVVVNAVTSAVLFGPQFPWPFSLDVPNAGSSLGAWYRQTFAQYDDTRWGFDKHIAAACAANPQSEELWRAVQETQFEKGGYIVWGQQDNLDAVAANVRGMTPSPVYNLNNWNLNDAWLA